MIGDDLWLHFAKMPDQRFTELQQLSNPKPQPINTTNNNIYAMSLLARNLQLSAVRPLLAINPPVVHPPLVRHQQRKSAAETAGEVARKASEKLGQGFGEETGEKLKDATKRAAGKVGEAIGWFPLDGPSFLDLTPSFLCFHLFCKTSRPHDSRRTRSSGRIGPRSIP